MRYIQIRHKLVSATLVSVAFVACIIFNKERNNGVLQVFFLDVGQGDAIYIRTPNGHDMLVDGGPSKIVIQRLSEVMPWYDKTIDVVLETHPDADHIGGLPHVLSRYHVGVFIEPGVESSNAIDDEIARLRTEKHIEGIYARQGMKINFGDGAHFDILYPDTDPSHFETNKASIVGKVIYGSTSVMLTGDSPKEVETYLVGLLGGRLRSDILKAGHHGSHTSSGKEYVEMVAPAWTILSSGAGNRYGHPHKDVIDLFSSLTIPVLRTDTLGTIGFESDGSAFKRK